jgi:hypothetical protein
MVIVDDVHPARLSNLFDRQAAGRKRTMELGFRPREIESGQPIRMLEDNHLSIVDGRATSGPECAPRSRSPSKWPLPPHCLDLEWQNPKTGGMTNKPTKRIKA